MKKSLISILLINGFILFFVIVFLNLTPGQFGYADGDGCSCVVSYNTSEPKPGCGFSRENNCNNMILINNLLLVFNLVDFNR